MVGFSWNSWVVALRQIGHMRQVRRPRTIGPARVEGLEDRALLTANLPVAVNDTYQVNTDTTLNASTVLANDTDADGDTISEAVFVSGVSHGTLNLAADGTFTYTPALGFTGADSFTYLARDAANGENSSLAAIVTINVGPVNSPPVATPDNINVAADTAFVGGLQGTDSDSDPLTFSAGSTAAAHGTVVIGADGQFTYTPSAGYIGSDSFSFKVNDGTEDSADALISVLVGPSSNNPPVATSVNINVATDTVFAGGLSGTDPDGDPLTFAPGSTIAAHGSVVINSDGNFTYTPNVGYTGTDSFSFTVSDGTFTSTNDGVVSVLVGAAGNTQPVATPVDIDVTLDTTFAGGLSGSDTDGDPLTFLAGSTLATHGTVVINPDGTFTYAPNAGYTGADAFSFKVNDGTDDSADATVTVLVSAAANAPPVATPTSIAVTLDTTFIGGLAGTDADSDPLTFAAGATAAAHGTVIINTDGSFSYTPDVGYTGTDSFSFKVNDGTDNSADATVSVVVSANANTPPVATPTNINVTLNTAFVGALAGTDADGNPLTFSAGATNATNGIVVINSDGTFSYTPVTGYTGSDSFSFRVNDGTENSADATVSVLVSAATNTPPVAVPTNINVALNTTFIGGLSGTDGDGDTLTFASGAQAAAHGTVVINSDGSFSYTPDVGFSGNDSFSFKVNDGTEDSADATVSVVVAAVTNTPPVATPTNINVGLDTAFSGSLAGTDADGDSLTFIAGTTAAAHGTVILNPNGTFTYTPDIGYTGTDSFSFKVNDGTVDSAEATVSVVVGTAANTDPIANPAIINTTLNNAVNGTLTGSDVDGDPLTFAIGNTTPAHGTVVINPDGTFTYTPDVGFVGNDVFNFRVNDGTSDSSVALVVVHVADTANVAPTVTTGSATLTANVAFNGSVSSLAIDLNGDPLTFTIVTPPTHGLITLSPDGTFLYVPDLNYTGSDSFTFKANDGSLDSNIGTFNLTIDAETAGFTLVVSGTPGTIATKLREVTPLDSTATLINIDPNVNFANAAVTASITSGADRRDRFVLTDGGTVDVRGRRIRVNGVEVARISGGRRGQALQVAFNASASAESVEAVVQRIGLKTTRNSASGPRVVQITVNADGHSNSASIVANKI